ncbi:MAG: hypothetical protein J6C19_07075 [Lachnospiraceae bacterium]|nr:hypothetical protein [Lachnospiraceae bacterium]
MKVYYGENFWGSGRSGTEMKEIHLNQDFLWDDISGFIPSVYVCSEGIAIDICIRVPNEPVRCFWDKWHQRLGEEMNEDEQETLFQENPLDIDFNVQICINGEKLENDFGCGACYTKEYENNMEGSLEEQLFLAYGCDESASWVFKRHMCRWDGQPQQMNTITVDFLAPDKPLACEDIELGLEDANKEWTLTSPVNGGQYTLHVDKVEQQELSEDMLALHQSRRHKLQYPRHYMTVSYHIEPELPENAFLLQSAGKGDKPRGQSAQAAAEISVIGGADGPTSIFIAGKRDRRQGRIAITALHFEPVERELWRPVFMIKERRDMRLVLPVTDEQ